MAALFLCIGRGDESTTPEDYLIPYQLSVVFHQPDGTTIEHSVGVVP